MVLLENERKLLESEKPCGPCPLGSGVGSGSKGRWWPWDVGVGEFLPQQLANHVGLLQTRTGSCLVRSTFGGIWGYGDIQGPGSTQFCLWSQAGQPSTRNWEDAEPLGPSRQEGHFCCPGSSSPGQARGMWNAWPAEGPWGTPGWPFDLRLKMFHSWQHVPGTTPEEARGSTPVGPGPRALGDKGWAPKESLGPRSPWPGFGAH